MGHADSPVSQADHEIHHPPMPVTPQREYNIQLALEQAYYYLHDETAVTPGTLIRNLRIALVEMRGEEWASEFDKTVQAR